MSSYLSAELTATCNALGYYDEKSKKYFTDLNTLETVKDLIRYLRRDDENFEIRRQLGEIKVLQTDLLPLLKDHWENKDLFDIVLRLLVNLTTPALVLWNEEPPTDTKTRNYYLQIEDHLQCYKEAFVDDGLWSAISCRLSKILEIEHADRGDENSLIIERILILIRNVLYVPVDQNLEKRPDNDPGIHDQVLWSLHQSGMFDIILYIASSINENVYYMHILEILCYMMRDQTGMELARATLPRSQTEKIRDEAELLAIRHREMNEKEKKLKKFTGARHSRFGGTYVVTTMKSISDNNMIYHKPLNKLDELSFDLDKIKPKTPKNRLPIQETMSEHRSALGVRLFLKEFCIEFLNGAYNTLMHYVKGNLERVKAQSHDESYYLWAMRFFMEFNRYYKFEVKLVSETMSLQAFHFVQQQMENHFDMIHSDKKKVKIWAKRLHLALLAYRELLFSLSSMDKSTDNKIRDSSKVIKSNIFYVLEYRELILTLLVTYDETKMSELYLKDLMETQHVFIKMLEAFIGNNSTVVVQKIKRKTQTKKKKQPILNIEIKLEEIWDRIAPQLSAVLEGDITIEIPPFDAASDVPIDEQKGEAMKKIQKALRDENFEVAIGLFRAAREVWPENNCFGSNDMTTHDEFLALRDVFFAKLGEEQMPIQPIYNNNFEIEDNEKNEEDEEYEDQEPMAIESEFKFEDFSKRLANPRVVQACGLALKRFERNTLTTNHCIVKLLHRIAFDCKMYVMLFQVSIFRTFQRIYGFKELPQYNELIKFATFIVRQFIKVANTNKNVFIEALFWKTSKECYDIEEGYGSYQEKSLAKIKGWTEEQEDELRRLFIEHQQNQIEEDVVDWIIKNMIDNTKTRRGVLKKLKEMYLLSNAPKHNKPNKYWSVEEEMQLRELYEEFKDSPDPLSCILDGLEVKRSKNRVIEKMLVMGLIQRKKRSKKSTQQRNSDGDNKSSDEERSVPSTSTKPSAKKAYKTKSKKKQKPQSVTVPKVVLVNHLKKIVELNMMEPLKWLKESFCDAIEDLDDCNEDVPLVPITEESIEAMENKDFQELLKGMGICQPFDEQESYWRISSTLGTQKLQELSDLLDSAINNHLDSIQINDNVEDRKSSSRSSSSSSSRSRSVSIERSKLRSVSRERPISRARSRSITPPRSRSMSRARSRSTSRARSRSISRARSRSISRSRSTSISQARSSSRSISQLSANSKEMGENEESTKKRNKVKASKRTKRIASSDDDDVVVDKKEKEGRAVETVEDEEDNKEKKIEEMKSPKLRSRSASASSSDTEKPIKKKRRVIISDDED